MKKTLFGRLAKCKGRIKKFVKKQRDARRFILITIAVMLVIPALSAKAEGVTVSQSDPIVTNLTVGPTLEADAPVLAVEVRTSPHQVAKRVATKISAVSDVSTETTDPGMDVKRQWTQKAASTWNIDWKLLEAVWQVETGKTWYTSRGSSAGARGPLQFMPGTWRAYAQDGNGDGVKNINDARDSLFGAAKLLAVNGAAEGNVDGALLRYNHSLAYVNKVKQIAASIGG